MGCLGGCVVQPPATQGPPRLPLCALWHHHRPTAGLVACPAIIFSLSSLASLSYVEFILSYALHQLFHMGLMDCVELARAGGLCVCLLLDLDRLLKKRKTHYYE